jgi:UDP-N-acetylglucosamine 4,6-dehydratase/5-epimerase
MIDLNNKTILITGGTGSFGKNFAKYLLKNFKLKKLIIFSRDELKQFHLENELKREGLDDNVRFFLGDVRDLGRLQRAFYGVDVIIHAAALKQVPTLEYNPFEAVKTNILGSQNVIEAAIDQKVEKVLLISTDKAAQPVNLYGSTKLCAEKLFISGNSYAGWRTKFSCVRYGNVIGSRGSIIEVLMQKRNVDKVTITDIEMTRFWITLQQAFDLVLFGLEHMIGGEIIVPKVPSMKLIDIFDTLAPEAEREIIGIRPGEKLHEFLLTEQEARHAVELDKYYVIIPEFLGDEHYCKYFEMGQKIENEFRYTSCQNVEWLKGEDLLKFII